jgi:hypothetical protein
VNPTRSANRIDTKRRSAVGGAIPEVGAGVAVAAVATPPARTVPHSPQNFAAASFDVPQLGQARARGEPHSRQNLRPGSFSVEQFEQIKGLPRRA